MSRKPYQGRRRLPKLPGKRYFAVVSTAIMAAGAVAFGAEVVLPEHLSNQEAGGVVFADQLDAAEQASRAAADEPAIILDASATDVWLLPLRMRYTISSDFAIRWGAMHYGVDLAAPGGTPIHATHAGTVMIADWYGGYGLCVEIDNGNGITTIYGHASALNVTRGEQVQAGDVISFVGTTGNSTGDHLHYEILVNGGEYDPLRFMKEHGVDLANRTEEATGNVPIG